MKVSKKILIALAAAVAVVGIALGLAFTSTFQKWALKRALPDAEVGRVSAGLSSADVKDLKFTQDGAVISVPSASAEYSAWDYMTGGGIRVSRLDAKGVVIDLRNYAPPAAAPQPESNGLQGLLGALLLPAGLRLDATDLDAEVILPGASTPQGRTLRVAIKGGGVGAGNEASFDYDASFADPSPAAALSALKAKGQLKFNATPDGVIENVSARVDLQAEGEGIPSGERIVLEAVTRKSGGTTQAFEVTISRQGATGPGTPLVAAKGTVDPKTGSVEGTWSVSVDNEHLASVLPTASTPKFEMAGSGKFAFDASTGDSSGSGDLKGSVDELSRVMPDLTTVGSLLFSASFSGGSDASGVRLDKVDARVATPGGVNLLSLGTLQAVAFNPETGKVSFADPSTDLATLDIAGLPIAWIAPLVPAVKLSGGEISGAFLVQATPTGDHVKLRSPRPLSIGPVSLSDESRTLVDRATINASLEVDYAADRIEASVTSWSLTTAAGDHLGGTANTVLVPGARLNVTFTFSTEGKLIAMTKPFSPVDVGILSIETGATGSLLGDTLTLQSGRLNVLNAAGAPLLSDELSQPIEVNLATMQAGVKNAATPAVSLAFGNLPLGWIEPFVAGSKLSGTVESGALELYIRTDGYSAATTKPVSLKGVSVAMDGKPLLDRVDATWDGTASMNGDTLKAVVRGLDVRQGTTSLLTLKGDFEVIGFSGEPAAMKGTAKGSAAANLGAVLGQPAVAEWRLLQSGRLNADFDLTSDSAITGKLRLAATGLVAMQDRKPLGNMTLSAEGRFTEGKGGEFKMPITVENGGRKSDLLFAGTAANRGDTLVLNGKLTGDSVFVEDFQPLGALVPTTGEPAATEPGKPAPPNTVRDTKPLWAGFEGTFDLDVKQLVVSADNPITNLKARAVVAADHVALENFSGTTNGSSVTASGALRFESAEKLPYALQANFKVPGLDMATFFKAADGKSPPTLETVVVADGSAKGRGLNLDDLISHVQGRVDVTGGKGVYRGLARQSGMVSSGAGLVGALFGGQKVQDTTQAVTELAGELKELHFDKMTLKAARGADLKLNIETLELISPKIRLTGKGAINMDPGTPIVKQSQRLDMRLGFKGPLGDIMAKARLTDGTKDELAYLNFRVPIILTGNVLSPDSKQFWEAVTRSMAEMGVQSLLGGQ